MDQSAASDSKSTRSRVYNRLVQRAVASRQGPNWKSRKPFSAAELESLHTLRTDWVIHRGGPLIASDNITHVGPPEPRHLVERKPVDDRLFTELAGLAKISAPGVERFRQCISYELDEAWIRFRHKFEPIDSEQGSIGLKQLQNLKTAWGKLSEVLNSLNDVALIPMRLAASERLNSLPTRDELKELLSQYTREMDEYVARVFFFATSASEAPVRGVGHPQGGLLTQWFDPFVSLVLNVLWDVDAIGGQLTLDKNSHEGSLVEALEAMESHLPPDFLPKRLPVSTLVRMKSAAKKFVGKYPMLRHPMFQDEAEAREILEAELWRDGPVCGYCGNAVSEKIVKVAHKKHPHRLTHYYCYECKRQFTVATKTILERPKIPLTKWFMAAYLFDNGKDGASTNEIQREIGVTYKTACFMTHRLQEWRKRLQDTFPRRVDLGFRSFLWEYGFGGMRSKYSS
jgi:transposase-like protein